MQIAAVQLDIQWESPEANFGRVRKLLEGEQVEAGAMIVLPELFACGFSMNVDRVGETEPRATERFLIELARQHQALIIGGVAARNGSSVQNQSVAIDPTGRNIARYAKLHPYTLGGEKEAYVAGDDVVLFDWHEFKVAPLICYDLRFPEIFRRAVRRGATLFVVIASWPEQRLGHWSTLLAARAIENQAYVVGVNRTGDDPHHRYCGKSVVIDPAGKILAEAGAAETLLKCEIDADRVAQVRSSFPFLSDMRNDFNL